MYLCVLIVLIQKAYCMRIKSVTHNKSFKTAGLPALLGRAKDARRLTLRYALVE